MGQQKPVVMKELSDLSDEEWILIKGFFSAFDFLHRNLKECLRNFIDDKGIFLYEHQGCLFPKEFGEFNDESLGSDGVLFVFEFPLCSEEEKEILISYNAFLSFVSTACNDFIKKYPKEQADILYLLRQLEEEFHNKLQIH